MGFKRTNFLPKIDLHLYIMFKFYFIVHTVIWEIGKGIFEAKWKKSKTNMKTLQREKAEKKIFARLVPRTRLGRAHKFDGRAVVAHRIETAQNNMWMRIRGFPKDCSAF